MGRAAVSATCAPELQTHRVALLFSTPRFDLDYNSGIFWGMLGKLHPYLAWATATAPQVPVRGEFVARERLAEDELASNLCISSPHCAI